MSEIIVSTTPALEGRPAKEYLGIVTGEVIVGANIVRDLFAGIRDIVGGRAGAYEDVLQRARTGDAAPSGSAISSACPRPRRGR